MVVSSSGCHRRRRTLSFELTLPPGTSVRDKMGSPMTWWAGGMCDRGLERSKDYQFLVFEMRMGDETNLYAK